MARRTRTGSLTALLLLLPSLAWARAGTLDPTFGVAGLAATGTPAVVDLYATLAVQADGRILAAGVFDDLSGPRGPGLARRLADGSLDPSFGTGGVVTAPPHPDFAQARKILVQPDGKIVVVGLGSRSTAPFVIGIVVARYEADGSLDPTFGSGGTVVLDDSAAGSFIANDAELDAGGAVVVAGAFWPTDELATEDVLLVRLTPAGGLDGTFGTGGVVRTDVGGGDDYAAAVVLEPGGHVVVAGTRITTDGVTADVLLARYDATGALDPAFGLGGVAVHDLGSLHDDARGLLRRPDGTLVLVGAADPAGDFDVVLARYDATGAPDPGFGTGGVVTTVAAGDDFPSGGLLAPDGKIVVVGRSGPPGAPALAISRHRADGARDGSFGTGGLTRVAAGAGFQSWGAVARQADDKLVAAGFTSESELFEGLVGRFGTGTCPPAPRPACKAPTQPGKALLQLRDRSPDQSDGLKWRWKGAATTLAELGDPLATTAYTFCLYDESGPSPVLVYEATAPAGGTCAGKPCWKAAGTKGFKRKDRTGSAEGLQGHVLKAGEAGRAQAIVKGKGALVGPPGLPLALPLRAQLHASDAACFEATYSLAVRNEASLFKASSD